MWKKNRDPFTVIAIKFILGVLIGFTMILMGFIFLMIAVLTQSSETHNDNVWQWYLATIVFEVVGGWLFYTTLMGAPEPGKISSRRKPRDWIKK